MVSSPEHLMHCLSMCSSESILKWKQDQDTPKKIANKIRLGDLPDGPMAKPLGSQCRGPPRTGFLSQGTRSGMQQLKKSCMPQRKSKTPHATTKTWHNRINELIKSKTKNTRPDLEVRRGGL